MAGNRNTPKANRRQVAVDVASGRKVPSNAEPLLPPTSIGRRSYVGRRQPIVMGVRIA